MISLEKVREDDDLMRLIACERRMKMLDQTRKGWQREDARPGGVAGISS